MNRTMFYLKPEANVVCKICKRPQYVSAPELSMPIDEVKTLTGSDILTAIADRQKVDGWHHDYCPRCTNENAARIAEEEMDEQI